MADTRVFRITYTYGKVKFGSRQTASNAVSSTLRSYIGRPVKVEATDKDALTGWADVSDEFLCQPDRVRCKVHPNNTGLRKPSVAPHVAGYRCACWEVYLDKHPEYPRHHALCNDTITDPQECVCRHSRIMTKGG